jgi:hypothetical protein
LSSPTNGGYAEVSTFSGLSSGLPKQALRPTPLDAIVEPSIPQKLGIQLQDADIVLEESVTVSGEDSNDRPRRFEPRV